MSTADRAKKALWQVCKKDITENGYVAKLEDNLVAGVRRKDFEKDFAAGAGQELKEKMLAVHSSSALVINTFSRFKVEPALFQMGKWKSASAVYFERKLTTGLGGTPPHLDVWVENPLETLAIESKLLEYLNHPKKAEFSASYEKLEAVTTDKQFWKLYRKILNGGAAYLDRAQLIKHCFGISNLQRKGGQATLCYLYWEPKNAESFEEFKKHRAELAEFSKGLEGSSIHFVAMTYTELWNQWAQKPELKEHVAALRNRYEVSI
jgi:hypothetical protein